MKRIEAILVEGLCLVAFFGFNVTPAVGQYFEPIEGTSVTEVANAGRTAGFVDVNDDGYLDIFFSSGDFVNDDQVFLNDGLGGFTQLVDEALNGVSEPSVGASWIDLENDGDLDAYVGTWYGVNNFLFLNEEGTFATQGENILALGSHTESVSWADFDKDGFLDVAIANSNSESNKILINHGDYSFDEVPIEETNGESRSANWADYNNDGFTDLLVTNENRGIYFYRNNNGTLSRAENLFPSTYNAFGASWGDMDNDGDLDLFLARFGETNVLLENVDGQFAEVQGSGATTTNLSTISSTWGDVDNDGYLDLYVVNGFGSGTTVNELYINNGDKTFTRVTGEASVSNSGWSYGSAFGDYDNDGFLDLAVANTFDDGEENSLFRNLGNSNNWLIVKLRGTVSNPQAIGARVTLYQSQGTAVESKIREVFSTSGYCSINDFRPHFGLGSNTIIDSLEILWPEGHLQTIVAPASNQILEVIEEMPAGYAQAHFSFSGTLEVEEEIQFTGTSTYDPTLETTFSWDFDGDGAIDSNEEAPKHTYTSSGSFNCSLTIANSLSTSTYERTLVIEQVLSTIDFELDQKVELYPNPSRGGKFEIRSTELIESIQLVDMSGSVMDGPVLVNSVSGQLQFEKHGAYILIVELKSGQKLSHKIIIN